MAEAKGDRVLAKRYRLLQPVARHAHTTMWRGIDEVLARAVGIKLLDHPDSLPGGTERFLAAAVAAGALAHPRIASVYDADIDHGQAYVVTEWVDGDVLEDLLTSGPLRPARATTIVAQVAEAVMSAHTAGVHHLDLDAQNVLICHDGSVKITDFAVGATVAEAEGSATGLDLTPVERDARALGALLYACLTGRSAYGAEPALPMAPRRHNRMLSPRQVRPTVPRELDEIVARTLEPDSVPAKRRIATPGQLLRELAPLPGEGGPSNQVEDVPKVRRTRTRWVRLGIPLAVVMATGLVGLAVGRNLGTLTGPGRKFPALTPAPSASAAAAAFTPKLVRDWDPYGDGKENPTQAVLAFDGDASTSWSTSHYRNDFGQFKPGVGLLFDLGEAGAAVREVRVAVPHAGVALELRATDTLDVAKPTTTLPPVVASLPSGSKDVVTIAVPAGTKARYWLVWVTGLIRGEGTGAIYSAGLAEVTFYR